MRPTFSLSNTDTKAYRHHFALLETLSELIDYFPPDIIRKYVYSVTSREI